MSLFDKLDKIKSVLIGISSLDGKVGHYEFSPVDDAPYCVWTEESEVNSLHAENQTEIQQLTGTIHYFTKTDEDPVVDEIQTALDDAQIGYQLNSIQYEDETDYIHFEWVWWIA